MHHMLQAASEGTAPVINRLSATPVLQQLLCDQPLHSSQDEDMRRSKEVALLVSDVLEAAGKGDHALASELQQTCRPLLQRCEDSCMTPECSSCARLRLSQGPCCLTPICLPANPAQGCRHVRVQGA